MSERLSEFGYFPCKHTPGLWKHKWRPVTFALVVNDFGVKYKGKQHAEHLLAALGEHYQFTVDWKGSLFCGIQLPSTHRCSMGKRSSSCKLTRPNH